MSKNPYHSWITSAKLCHASHPYQSDKKRDRKDIFLYPCSYFPFADIGEFCPTNEFDLVGKGKVIIDISFFLFSKFYSLMVKMVMVVMGSEETSQQHHKTTKPRAFKLKYIFSYTMRKKLIQ